MEQELAATLTVFGAAPTPAVARLLTQTARDRALRVLAALGIFWGLAIPAVFMPVAHFILVPTLLLTGIAVAALRAREGVRLLGARGRCPRCGAETEFPGSGRFRSPHALDCPRCHTRLSLTVGPWTS
jgi:hypothetical protein